MVATFSKLKDYNSYFKAAQLILEKHRSVTFIAIGDGTDSFEAVNLIENRYLKNFRLLGRKSNIESYINAMDICILSTFTEGISNSILEYMALGKPVIATRGGGTSEIVIDNKTGFLISPSNPEELTDKIEKLLNNIDLREQMGMAGKERVKKIFSSEIMVSKYVDFYKTITKT